MNLSDPFQTDLNNSNTYDGMLFIVLVSCSISLVLMIVILSFLSARNKGPYYVRFCLLNGCLLFASFVVALLLLYFPLNVQSHRISVGDQLFIGQKVTDKYLQSMRAMFCKTMNISTTSAPDTMQVWMVSVSPNFAPRNNFTLTSKDWSKIHSMRFRLHAKDRLKFRNAESRVEAIILKGEKSYQEWLTSGYGRISYEKNFSWRRTSMYGKSEFLEIESYDIYTIILRSEDKLQNSFIDFYRNRYEPTKCDPIVCRDVYTQGCTRPYLTDYLVIDYKLPTTRRVEFTDATVNVTCDASYETFFVIFLGVPVGVVLIVTFVYCKRRRVESDKDNDDPVYAFDNHATTAFNDELRRNPAKHYLADEV